MGWVFGVVLNLMALFLIFLVLIQRGRGGGLSGAFGGSGGSSAFGTRAGDVFTKITIGVAATWILLCILAIKLCEKTNSKKLRKKSEQKISERGATNCQ